jgi:hypothetical protein
MDHRLLGLLVIAVWGAAAIALFYARERRIGYLAALRTCLGWAGIIVAFMLFNYRLADQFALSRSPSGFARGKQVISAYAFLVQLLLIIEIALAVAVRRAIQRWRAAADRRELHVSPVNHQSARAMAAQPALESEAPVYREERNFAPSLLSVFFLCCSLGNFWLAAKALQRNLFGLFFLVVGLGLLVAAYKASFVSRFRRK